MLRILKRYTMYDEPIDNDIISKRVRRKPRKRKIEKIRRKLLKDKICVDTPNEDIIKKMGIRGVTKPFSGLINVGTKKRPVYKRVIRFLLGGILFDYNSNKVLHTRYHKLYRSQILDEYIDKTFSLDIHDHIFEIRQLPEEYKYIEFRYREYVLDDYTCEDTIIDGELIDTSNYYRSQLVHYTKKKYQRYANRVERHRNKELIRQCMENIESYDTYTPYYYGSITRDIY